MKRLSERGIYLPSSFLAWRCGASAFSHLTIRQQYILESEGQISGIFLHTFLTKAQSSHHRPRNSNYQIFFRSLAVVEDNFLTQDRHLYEHRAWFVREMRLRAYQQLLQSYRVVGLKSMANDFGVTVDFLDR